MLACHCYAVSDRIVRAEVARGARTVEEIGRACGAGSRCTGCHEVLEEILVEQRVAVGLRNDHAATARVPA